MTGEHQVTVGAPQPGRSHPSDGHGRRLSTTAEAAARYRKAQQAVPVVGLVRRALGAALDADPSFVIAGAALSALERRRRTDGRRPSTSWERRHLDVVAATWSARPERAVDLLREHLFDVGCDPIACLVVSTVVVPAEMDDLLACAPGCHPWTTEDRSS